LSSDEWQVKKVWEKES